MSTCNRCRFFRQHFGERQGVCLAQPPTVYSSGSQADPTVKIDRPACRFFDALPDGVEAAVKSKVSPETPNDALKQKRQMEALAKKAKNSCAIIGVGRKTHPDGEHTRL